MRNYSKIPLIVSVALLSAQGVRALDFTDQGEYMGSSDCRSCHERFYELWSTSHHGTAMQAFSGAFARTLVPMKEEMQIGKDRFFIELNDAGGIMRQTDASGATRTYPVLHALGGKNVYFFLVPLEKGKLQVAPLAYNVQTHEWYDSTGSMVRHFNRGIVDAALDWTDRQLTFNTACHDCHVSQLRQNYDPETDSYQTTWKESGINCEVCHGPAEAHIQAAQEALDKGEKLEDLKILSFRKDLSMAQRDATCAPCHAKMVPLSRTFTPGELFFDHYDLISYESHDFYADGRDLGENYTQTGWMANPCANSGQLECIHCHTSSGRFRFKDSPNLACMPCHEERVDGILEHSHHPADAHVSCIDCHMPRTAQSHMTRSDHSFRPPSPAASMAFGSPNACNLCHNDKDAIAGEFTGHRQEDMEWANEHIKTWYGDNAGAGILELGHIIQACRDGAWDQLPEILAYLESPKSDPAAKVAILRLLNQCPDAEKWPAVRRQLNSKSEWVRSAAAASLEFDESMETTKLLLKAAGDDFLTVRIRAAAALLGRDLARYGDKAHQAFEAARAEYWNSLVIWPDRWSTYFNQGVYFDRTGEPDKALAAYRKAMQLRDDVVPPILNASMVYARTGDSTNAYELLKQAYQIEPASPQVNFNMALIEAEFGKLDECEKHLRAALKAAPNMASAAYNLGVLLCQQNKEEGYEWLRKAVLLAPENWDYLYSYHYFLEQNNRQAEIGDTLKAVVASGRASARAYFALAAMYESEGDYTEAAEIYRKASVAKHLPERAQQYASKMEEALRMAMEQESAPKKTP